MNKNDISESWKWSAVGWKVTGKKELNLLILHGKLASSGVRLGKREEVGREHAPTLLRENLCFQWSCGELGQETEVTLPTSSHIYLHIPKSRPEMISSAQMLGKMVRVLRGQGDFASKVIVQWL